MARRPTASRGAPARASHCGPCRSTGTPSADAGAVAVEVGDAVSGSLEDFARAIRRASEDITGQLAGKRARIHGTDSGRGGEIVVKAQVPLSELTDYAAELKGATAGRGRYDLAGEQVDELVGLGVHLPVGPVVAELEFGDEPAVTKSQQRFDLSVRAPFYCQRHGRPNYA